MAVALTSCQLVEDESSQKQAENIGPLLFVTPQGLDDRPAIVLAAMANSRVHNRDPARYLTADLNKALLLARSGNPAAVHDADKRLLRAFLRWARDMDAPRGVRPIETDAGAAIPAFDSEAVLLAAANAPDLAAHLERLQQRHPMYSALSTALANELAAGRTGVLLARNLERARALPAFPKGKHVVVDAAGARLWMYDGIRQAGSMKVVTGRPAMPTPLMSGVIRYVVVQPYWNLPVDIVRDSIAPAVLHRGPAVVDERGLEILADWTAAAKPVAATRVDWRAVAAGDQTLRVRQRPGPENMMGRVKFMLPNNLGIYLHDTPKIADFGMAQRAKSSGCVRVEDAPRLARWLFDGVDPMAQAGTDTNVPLPRAVPVYISYFTVSPAHRKPVRNFDVYGRDVI